MASTVIDRLDGLSSTTAYKGPCRLASPTHVQPNGLRVVDGVQTEAGDRVVLTNQNDPRQNGIFAVDTGNWRRTADFNKSKDVVKGTRVWVVEGTSGPAELEVTSDDPIRIGVDPITFGLSAGSVNAAALSDALRQVLAKYDDLQPRIISVAVGAGVQSVSIGDADLPRGFVRVFIDGVFQFDADWALAAGILTPIGEAWPGDGVRKNMQILIDPASTVSFSIPVNGSVTPTKINPTSEPQDWYAAFGAEEWPQGDVTNLGPFAVWAGQQARTLQERGRDVCHILDFNGADPSGNNDSSSALIAWLAQAQAARVKAVLGGRSGAASFITQQELEIIQPGQVIEFENSGGYGYGENVGLGWVPHTRLVAAGAMTKRVRTRRLFRGSAGDPQDAALSAVLNIQAEGVILDNPCVWLNCDYTNLSPSNLGDNVDIGIFSGTRVGVQINNAQVIGYFRRAGIYIDVSGQSNLPRMLSKAGTPYPDGTVKNGADGTHLYNPYIRGGRVGLAILGAKPKVGQTGYSDAYYDQQLGGTVADARGSFGASDFAVFGGRIYGPDHHSNRRLKDPVLDGGVLSQASMASEPDDAPAAVHIDGIAGNASGNIWGMSFYGTRVASFEAFRMRLDGASRVRMFGGHIEGRNGGRLSVAGASINTNDYTYNSYGDLAGTARTDRVTWLGSVRQSPADGAYPHFYGGNGLPTLLTDSGRLYTGDYIQGATGEIDLRGRAGNGARLRNDVNTIMQVAANGIYDNSTAASANVYVGSTGLLQRSTSSERFKVDIEPLDDEHRDLALQFEPIFYRSTADGDNPEWSWYGFSAEQIGELDPRLVHWRTLERKLIESDGEMVETFERLEVPVADGVMYERIVVHHNAILKSHEHRIAELEAAIELLLPTVS